ncbi:42341_t:CDS:2, partial [Gigaspora margarita]
MVDQCLNSLEDLDDIDLLIEEILNQPEKHSICEECNQETAHNNWCKDLIKDTFNKWMIDITMDQNKINETYSEIYKQIQEIENIAPDLSQAQITSHSLSYNTHTHAIYTSRLLDFVNPTKFEILKHMPNSTS